MNLETLIFILSGIFWIVNRSADKNISIGALFKIWAKSLAVDPVDILKDVLLFFKNSFFIKFNGSIKFDATATWIFSYP